VGAHGLGERWAALRVDNHDWPLAGRGLDEHLQVRGVVRRNAGTSDQEQVGTCFDGNASDRHGRHGANGHDVSTLLGSAHDPSLAYRFARQAEHGQGRRECDRVSDGGRNRPATASLLSQRGFDTERADQVEDISRQALRRNTELAASR
jgi:hypothetical protein